MQWESENKRGTPSSSPLPARQTVVEERKRFSIQDEHRGEKDEWVSQSSEENENEDKMGVVVKRCWETIPREELNTALGHLLEMMHLFLHVVFPVVRHGGGGSGEENEDLEEKRGRRRRRMAGSLFTTTPQDSSASHEEEEEEEEEQRQQGGMAPWSTVPHPNTMYCIRWRHPCPIASTTTTPPPPSLLSHSSVGEVLFSFHWAERLGGCERASYRTEEEDTIDEDDEKKKKKKEQKKKKVDTHSMLSKKFQKADADSSSFVVHRMVLEPHGNRSTIALYEETGTSFFSGTVGAGGAEEEEAKEEANGTHTKYKKKIKTRIMEKAAPPSSTPRRLPFFLAPTFSHWFRQEPLSEALILFSLLVREVVAMMGRLVDTSQHDRDRPTTPKKRGENEEEEEEESGGRRSRSSSRPPMGKQKKRAETSDVDKTAAAASPPPSSFFFPPPFEIALDGSISGLSVEREAQTQSHYWTLALRRLLMMVQWCMHMAIQLSQQKRSLS